MKKILFVLLLMSVLLAGCYQQEPYTAPTNTPTTASPNYEATRNREATKARNEEIKQQTQAAWSATAWARSTPQPGRSSSTLVYKSYTTDGQECNIKGNINMEGEKIYHVPGGEFYDATVINEKYGERWFCSEEDARAAGWRKSKQ